MNNEELVSIVIPTYFRESLAETIESALSQTYSPVEVIVVDDSGERYAEGICGEYEVEYIAHKRNQGGNPARNTGLRHANGTYVQLLDDDDVIRPDKLARQAEVLESSSAIGVAYGGIKARNGECRYPSEEPIGEDLRTALQFNWWTTITSSLLIERDLLMELYPLATRDAADDVGMRVELARRSEFGHVDEVLTELGDSAGSRSANLVIIGEYHNIMREYAFLYEEFPPSVRRGALSYVFRMEGHLILEQRHWSPAATRSFCRSLYYSNGFDMQLVGVVLLSVFGISGIRTGRRLLNAIK